MFVGCFIVLLVLYLSAAAHAACINCISSYDVRGLLCIISAALWAAAVYSKYCAADYCIILLLLCPSATAALYYWYYVRSAALYD